MTDKELAQYSVLLETYYRITNASDALIEVGLRTEGFELRKQRDLITGPEIKRLKPLYEASAYKGVPEQ